MPRNLTPNGLIKAGLVIGRKKGSIAFKLWAPTAKKVELLLYQSTDLDAPIWKTIPMMRGKQESSYHPENTHGVWILDFLGNLSGMAYQYRVHFEHQNQVTRDPYSIATTADGMRSAILSQEQIVSLIGALKRRRCDSPGAWTILVNSDLWDAPSGFDQVTDIRCRRVFAWDLSGGLPRRNCQ